MVHRPTCAQGHRYTQNLDAIESFGPDVVLLNFPCIIKKNIISSQILAVNLKQNNIKKKNWE